MPTNLERLKRLEEVKDTLTKKQYRDIKQAVERELCKESLAYLVTEVLDPDYYKPILADFHYEMMAFAQSTSTRKLLLVPRGHLKSSLVTVPLIIQTLLKNPNARILLTNATLDNAQGFLRSIKGYFESNEKLRYLFGEFKSDKWNESEIVIRQRNKKQIKENSVATSSVDKSIVSQHFDLIIGDDLVNRESINTREQLSKTKLYYKDLLDLLDPKGTMVIIGTRWHYDDLYQYILDNSSFDTFFRTCWNTPDKKSTLFPKIFTQEYLEYLRKEKGTYEFSCTPAETPILMADWTTKVIKDIAVGDEIIGWVNGTSKKHTKLKKVKVKSVFQKIDTVCDIKMQSGRKVRCTKDHKWYAGRSGGDKTHAPYVPAKIGRSLMFVCPVEKEILTEEQKKDWYWLSGFFDGEGSTKSGGCLNFTQSHEVNPECYKKLIDVLTRLELNFSEYERKYENNDKWSDSKIIWVKDNFNTSLRFIRNTELAKKEQIINRLFRISGRFTKEEDKVLEIKTGGEEVVYALETETGNYVAWGYASSNSQYENNPVDDETATFKESWFRYFTELDEEKTYNYFLTIDTAGGGEGKNADSNGWILNAVDTQDNWYLEVVIGDKVNATEIIDRIFALNSRYPALTIGLEKTMFTNAFKPLLEKEMSHRGVFLNIVELKHSLTSKEQRIKGLVPLFERHKIWMREDQEDLKDQTLRFPKGKHDDILDALCMQIEIAKRPNEADYIYDTDEFRRIQDNRFSYQKEAII